MKIVKRLFQLNLPRGRSAFLWGPRKVGKSYWIRHSLPHVPVVDLLKTDVFADYASRPSLIRERFQNHKGLIVLDEIQRVPALLDEVHWLIENRGLSFLLTGSSARKLRRGHANLLGGRAWRKTMVPLSVLETEGFNLERVMVAGLLPPHYLSPEPLEDLRAYVADYLKEEIAAEALIQNVPSFSEFFQVAAISSSELLNYVNVARETGVSHRTVRTYFDILEDTYLGFRIPPWKKSRNRRMIVTEKFYLFDVGIANYLKKKEIKDLSGEDAGRSLEHFILMELIAYIEISDKDFEINYWRTKTGLEVDFILGEGDVAIEVKIKKEVHKQDIKGLIAFKEENPKCTCYVISQDPRPRKMTIENIGEIFILPYKEFLDRLWNDKIV